MINEEDAVKNKYLVISVIGSHAGEDLAGIFLRKQQEIEKAGKSYWLIQSHKATTQQVQILCKKAETQNISVYCLFIHPSQKGGAKATTHNQVATLSSSDWKTWESIPNGIKITGRIGKNSTGLVFGELKVLNAQKPFDLWQYSEFGTKKPAKTMLGASTICCERIPSEIGMKKRYREIVGIGKFVSPYGLWLK